PETELCNVLLHHFFFQAEHGKRNYKVTGVQTCALPISRWRAKPATTPSAAARATTPCPAATATTATSTATSATTSSTATPATTRSEERRVGKGIIHRGVT